MAETPTILRLALGVALLLPALASARASGDPIRLTWDEGDIAGMSSIYAPSGDQPIGFVEYHQTRRGDVLSTVRLARFRDGSSDEDWAEARVAGTLQAISGRSIVRDADGRAVTDLSIDVAAGRLVATWRSGDHDETADEHVNLPAGTYFGPLIFLVLKNFDANAEDNRLVFRTVAPTPRPLAIDMELRREGRDPVSRLGTTLDTVRFELRPTIHWAIDPLVRMVAPRAAFWALPGDPPALARFSGPRNYAGQAIRIE